MAPLHKQKSEELKMAFTNDAERLLSDYKNLQSYNYPEFAMLWRTYKFSLVYTDFETDEELGEFTEIAYKVLKQHLVSVKDPYVQAGALFTLYGMYFKQPIKDLKKIRLTFQDYLAIMEFIDEMKASKHFHPVYIFAKMKMENTFDYVYLDNPVAPDFTSQTHTQQIEFTPNQFTLTQSTMLQSAFESLGESNVVEIANIDQEYRQALKDLQEKYGEANLQIYDTNPAEEIKTLMAQSRDVAVGRLTEGVGEKRRNLKGKAMALKNPDFRSKCTISAKKTKDSMEVDLPN